MVETQTKKEEISEKMEVVISATIYDSEDLTEYVYLLKDNFDQFYLLSLQGGFPRIRGRERFLIFLKKSIFFSPNSYTIQDSIAIPFCFYKMT